MKTKIFNLMVACCSLLLMGSCSSSINANESDNDFTTRNLTPGNFDRIVNKSVCNVQIAQTKGNCYLIIDGKRKWVNAVNTELKDGCLTISMDPIKSRIVHGDTKLTITIGLPSLKMLESRGVGNISIADMKQNGLAVNSHGVGNITFENLTGNDIAVESRGVGNLIIKNFKGNNIEVNSRGVGNVIVSGTVHSANLDNRGVGNLIADKLSADKVIASNHGVGNLNCCANQSITAINSGMGNLNYNGNPEYKDVNRTGIGNISHTN